jgi:hypothetical protein
VSVRVVAFVPDLMDRSRLSAALPDAVLVADVSALAAGAADADVAVVDLDRAGVLDALADLTAVTRVVGFASHVDDEVLRAARRAGCHAMARSRFFRDVPEAVGGG